MVEHSQISLQEAKVLVDRVRRSVDEVRDAIVRLWQGRAWMAMGYGSWDELCFEEFQMRLALPRAERRALVGELRSEGMSTRGISSALGIARNTVVRELEQVAQVEPPAQVLGGDGKVYRPTATPPKVPRPSRMRALADEYSKAVSATGRAVEQLRSLHGDPRFYATWDTLGRDHGSTLAGLLAAMTEVDKDLRTGPRTNQTPVHACTGAGLCRTVGCRA